MGSCSSSPESDSRARSAWTDDSPGKMPFLGKGKEKINYKARLEHKQYLAQESPAPIYDISQCALKNVPSGVFSRCKVARKEALLLHENELTSLTGGGKFGDLAELQVLDLHRNCLEKLPEDFGLLTNLRVLNLQDNKLKSIPAKLGSLARLETLNLSGNCLKEIPASISGLTSLRTLDLRNNPKLKKIPKEMAHLQCLSSLLLDPDHLIFPSPELVSQGTEAVMRALCKECSIEYVSPSEAVPTIEQNGNSNGTTVPYRDPYEDIVRGHLDAAERQKEERRKQTLEFELQLQREAEKELELKKLSEENKKKLLADLHMEETRNEDKLAELQRVREEERKELGKRMLQEEQRSDQVITELMQSGARYSDPAKVMAALEADRKAMEDQFTIVQGDVEKLKVAEVRRMMQDQMEAEIQKKATARQWEERQGVIREAITSSLENDKAVEEALQSKGKQQEEIISKMLEEEKYQKEAFQSLLLTRDHRASEIQDHMAMIQNELATLTMVEMKKRDMKVEFETELMCERRDKLTKLLLDLMERQKQRAEDLQNMMLEMETGREQEQENYWLIQYQKLLDSKPRGLEEAEKGLDGQVKDLLLKCNLKDLIPVFAKRKVTFKELSYMEDTDLKKLGVTSPSMRATILSGRAAVEAGEDLARLNIEGGEGGVVGEATAPPGEDTDIPSAPDMDPVETFHSSECVICMEKKCDILFLPCGHLCSCSSCQGQVSTCPLCRTDILQRVRL